MRIQVSLCIHWLNKSLRLQCWLKAVDPGISLCYHNQKNVSARCALAGNRTRASRVAGENSTTEPPMLPLSKGRRVSQGQLVTSRRAKTPEST